MSEERRWLKASEAGTYLGLHIKSVYRACSQGKIPSSKVPGIGLRIDKRELDILLEQESLDPSDLDMPD